MQADTDDVACGTAGTAGTAGTVKRSLPLAVAAGVMIGLLGGRSGSAVPSSGSRR